jgi:hypothetical protein
MCAALVVDYALSLSGFPADLWNTWAADSGFYTSHAWLRMVESDGEARAGYLIARRGDTPVGALPVYESVAEGNPAYRTQTLLDGRWQGTYLLAGARRTYANAVLVAPDLDAADRRTVVATLVDEARGLARRRGHAGPNGGNGSCNARPPASATRFNRHCGAGWRSRYGAAPHAAEWPL